MTKRKTLLTILLGLIMALCLSFAVACGGGKDEGKVGNINWKITGEKDHVTVMVDGSTDLPSTYAADTALTFTVTPDTGYEVTVMNGRITLRAQNGSYSFQVKEGNNDITITVTKGIKGVSVTKNPTKMIYYAGETLDTTGMEVTITYKTSDSDTEVLPGLGYVVNYPNAEAGYFELGDTSFTVTYGSFTSAAVQLEKAVVGKITVDPAGGDIEGAYEYQLKAMPGISNVTRDETTKAYSFTFDKPIPENIPLPLNAQLSRGAEGEYKLLGMQENGQTVTNIPADTAISHTYTAAWVGKLVDLSSIKYEKRTVDGVELPFLVFKGKFNAANKVQLILHEGNANVTFEGDTAQGTKGGDFELTLNMRTLATEENGKFLGKWMDIIFAAESNVGGNTVIDRQEISILDYDEEVLDMDDNLSVGGVTCTFQNYNGMLKAVANLASDAGVNATVEYTMTLAMENNVPTLTFNGTIEAEHNGKTVTIDYDAGGTITAQDATIADGKFVVKFDLTQLKLTTIAYFHFYLKDGGVTVYTGDNDGNLLNAWCKNTDMTDNGAHAPDGGNGNLLNSTTLKLDGGDGASVYYVGRGKWGGIIAYGENEAVAYTSISVENRENTPYYVIGGTYNEALAKDKVTQILTKEWESGDISNNPDAGSLNSSWDIASFSAKDVFKVEVDETEHTFKLVIALPEGAGHGWILFLHISANNNFMGTGCEIPTETVKIGNLEYAMARLSGYTDTKVWMNGLPVLIIRDDTKPQLAIDPESHVELLVDNYSNATKVYYVVSVWTQNVAIDKVFFGNSDSGELYGADATLSKLDEHGSGKLYFDITSYTGTQLWPHLYYQEEDGTYTHFVEIKDADSAVGSLYAIVGGRKYMLKNSMETYYTDVCVVTEETSETVNPPITDKDFAPSSIDAATLALTSVSDTALLSISGKANTKYYKQGDVKLYLYNTAASSRLPVAQTIEWKSDGSFTIKADLTELPISVVSYGIRVYFGNFESYTVYGEQDAEGSYAVCGEKAVVLTYAEFGLNATVEVVDKDKVVVEPDDPNKTYAVTGGDIVNENGTVYFTISGIYEGYSDDEINALLTAIYFDFQFRGDPYPRYDDLTRTVTADDGAWTIKFDVSDLAVGPYTAHFIYDATQQKEDDRYKNLNIDPSALANGKNIKVGERTYTITNVPGSSKPEEFWGSIGLTIENDNDPKADMDFDKLKVSDENGVPTLTIEGTYRNVEKSAFSLAFEEYNTWTPQNPTTNVTLNDDGTYVFTADLSKIPASTKHYVFKYKIVGALGGSDGSLIHDAWEYGKVISKVTVEGKTYSLEVVQLWNQHRIQLIVEDATTKCGPRITNVDLKTDEAQTKAYYVVTIKSAESKETLLEKLSYGGDSDSAVKAEKIEELEDGTFEVYFDVTSFSNKTYSHLYYDGKGYDGGNGDIKLGTNTGKTVTVGGKTYTIVNGDGDWGMDNLNVT